MVISYPFRLLTFNGVVVERI